MDPVWGSFGTIATPLNEGVGPGVKPLKVIQCLDRQGEQERGQGDLVDDADERSGPGA